MEEPDRCGTSGQGPGPFENPPDASNSEIGGLGATNEEANTNSDVAVLTDLANVKIGRCSRFQKTRSAGPRSRATADFSFDQRPPSPMSSFAPLGSCLSQKKS